MKTDLALFLKGYPSILLAAVLVIFLVFAAAFFSRYVGKTVIPKKRVLRMSGYRMIYSDQKPEKRQKGVEYSRLLYSAKYDLQGKPDFIFQRRLGNVFIPVEMKSGTIGQADYPHEGDILQMAAYFCIIEDVYGHRPPYGNLIYQDCMFRIRNTGRLRRQLMDTMKEMRQMLRTGKGQANPSFVSCRHCVCRGTVCAYCEDKYKG